MIKDIWNKFKVISIFILLCFIVYLSIYPEIRNEMIFKCIDYFQTLDLVYSVTLYMIFLVFFQILLLF